MTTQPRIHLVSLGCAKNLVDSETLLGRLAAAGAVVGAPAEEADVVIVNTCGFIDSAKEESIDTLFDLAELKDIGRCRALFVMGCLAERYADELREQIPELDGVFGLADHDALIVACGLTPGEDARLRLTPPHTAYLRIAEGCDNRCAYCAIPLIRGPFCSRPADAIVDEARRLIDSGAVELNLIGQDTSLYGADRPGAPRIAQLLARLDALDGLRWLRLLYTHPAHVTDDLVDAYAALDTLCEYVDLPLQHLDDTILQRMGRRVTEAEVRRLIWRLRDRVPGVAVRTAMIVGFPGETRAQFETLLRGVEELRFDHLGAFTYSREEGTPAADFPDQVDEAEKQRRLDELMHVQQRIVADRLASMAGRTVDVLIDGRADTPGRWSARTRTQAPDVDSTTLVAGDDLAPGRILPVRITGHEGYDLLAQ